MDPLELAPLDKRDVMETGTSDLDVTFFVPCYNEENNVIGAIEKLVQVAEITGITYEILVFDDCSTDGTVEVVRTYQSKHPDVPLRLFTNKVNRGVARNFVEGAFKGRGKYYRLVCGDDCEPLETHVAIVQHRCQADMIIPYWTEITGRKADRHFLSRLYTVLVNLASGYRLRYYNGLPLFQRYDIMRFHIETTGVGFQAEFLTRLLRENKSYLELPLATADRGGTGALTIKNFISVGHSLVKMALSRLRVYLFKE